MDTEIENYNNGRQDFKQNLAKLMASESYAQIAPLLFPELSKDELERLFLGFENVGQFQSVAMKRACEALLPPRILQGNLKVIEEVCRLKGGSAR